MNITRTFCAIYKLQPRFVAQVYNPTVVSQAGFEPTRFAEQRDSFPYIRFNGQTHRFPPFPLLGVGQLCLPVSPLRQMAVL